MAKGYSLHIGLNSVDPSRYGGWSGRLQGCVPDANDMEAIAKAQGIRTQKLLDSAATASAVLSAIRSYAETMSSGDYLLISFSGHGGQIPDRTGEEADKLDETWCLWDRQLIDDELDAAWRAFRSGVDILVLSDSCHSGTVTKAVDTDELPARFAPLSVTRANYLAYSSTYDAQKAAAAVVLSTALLANVMLIAACGDDEVTRDMPTNGVFTDALKKVWNNGTFTGNHTQFRDQIRIKGVRIQKTTLYWNGPVSYDFLARKPFTFNNVVWFSDGRSLTGDPAVATNASGTDFVAVVGENNVLQVVTRDMLGNNPVWTTMGKSPSRTPQMATDSGKRPILVVQTTDGLLWSCIHDGRSWSDFVPVGTKKGQEYALSPNGAGKLVIFLRGMDNVLWQTRQTSAYEHAWESWTVCTGGAILNSGPSAGLNSAARLEVVARGPGNQAYRTAEGALGKWDSWNVLGGALAGAPVVARQSDGRLVVFALGSNGTLTTTLQTGVEGNWTGWTDLGGRLVSQPVVGKNQDGRLQVFARGGDGNLHHCWQTKPSGPWSAWEVLFGAIAGTPAVTNFQDGSLVVYARSPDGKLMWTRQTRPNSPDWDRSW